MKPNLDVGGSTPLISDIKKYNRIKSSLGYYISTTKKGGKGGTVVLFKCTYCGETQKVTVNREDVCVSVPDKCFHIEMKKRKKKRKRRQPMYRLVTSTKDRCGMFMDIARYHHTQLVRRSFDRGMPPKPNLLVFDSFIETLIEMYYTRGWDAPIDPTSMRLTLPKVGLTLENLTIGFPPQNMRKVYPSIKRLKEYISERETVTKSLYSL